MAMTKNKFKSIDTRKKINNKAYFIDSWHLPIVKKLIEYDVITNNIISIYYSWEFYYKLWIIVKEPKEVMKRRLL